MLLAIYILCHENFLSATQSNFSCRTLKTCVDLKTKKKNEQKTNENLEIEKVEECEKTWATTNVKQARNSYIIIVTLKMQLNVHQFLAKYCSTFFFVWKCDPQIFLIDFPPKHSELH